MRIRHLPFYAYLSLFLCTHLSAQWVNNDFASNTDTLPKAGFGLEFYPSFYLGKLKGGGVDVLFGPSFSRRLTLHIGTRYFSGVDSTEDRPGTLDIVAPENIRLYAGLRYWINGRFEGVFTEITTGFNLKPTGFPFISVGIGGTFNIYGPAFLLLQLSIWTRSVEVTPVIVFPRFKLALCLYLFAKRDGAS